MNLLNRIAVDPAIRFGKPCIRGTRISVGDVLGYLAGGMSEDQILSDFPQLTREDVRACLAYAAERERRTSFGFASAIVRLRMSRDCCGATSQRFGGSLIRARSRCWKLDRRSR